MKSITLHVALALGLATVPAAAQSSSVTVERNSSAFALSLDAGTTGIGASLWFTVSPRFTFTLGYGSLGIDEDYSTDEADYSGRADLSNAHALLNWHPFGGGFHLTGGAVLADDTFDATGTPGSGTTYEFNGVVYTAAQVGSLNGSAKIADGLVPYVGLGWSKSPQGAGWGLFADLGVMFSGSVETTLTASGPIASDPTFQANLTQEQRDLQDELDEYKIFPVVRVGVMFRF